MFDLKKYLEDHAEVKERYNDSTELVIACACDQRDGSGHNLWCNVKKLVGFCYRCETPYSLIDIIKHVSGCDTREAFALVREGTSPRTRLKEVLDGLLPAEDPPEAARSTPISLPVEYQPVVDRRPDYLRDRKVSLADCRRLKLGWCATGYYRNRVVIPVVDLKGQLVSFVARYMGPPPSGGKKILHPRGSKISTVLFNHKRAAKAKTVVVCEGPFDALRVGRNAVCLFGKHASPYQLGHLIALGSTRRLVIMLDPDAEDDALELAESLAEVCDDVRLARLPEGRKDPGECDAHELAYAVEHAEPIGKASARLVNVLGALAAQRY